MNVYSFLPLIYLVISWIVLIIVSVVYPSTWVLSYASHFNLVGGDLILQAMNSLIFGLVDTLAYFALDLDMDEIGNVFGITDITLTSIIIGSLGALIAMLMAVSVEKLLEKMLPNAILEGPLWLDALGFITGVILVVCGYLLSKKK